MVMRNSVLFVILATRETPMAAFDLAEKSQLLMNGENVPV
jgi:hypothetical protein